jgi:hypothetical protein
MWRGRLLYTLLRDRNRCYHATIQGRLEPVFGASSETCQGRRPEVAQADGSPLAAQLSGQRNRLNRTEAPRSAVPQFVIDCYP